MVKKAKEEVKVVTLSEAAQKIWNDIKNLPVEYYGLQGKRISDVCEPNGLSVGSELFVNLVGPASLSSMDEALAKFLVKSDEGVVQKFLTELVRSPTTMNLKSGLAKVTVNPLAL